MGKDVTLSPGSYHKIRSVYEHSMRDDPRFSRVRFVEDVEPSPHDGERLVRKSATT